MNCCNEYGECRQGRDCPVRIERMRQVIEKDGQIKQSSWLAVIVILSTIALVFWTGYVNF